MLSFQTAYPGIERYAQFDFDEIAAEADKKWGLDPRLINIEISADDDYDNNETIYTITGTFQIEDLEVPVTYQAYDNPEADEIEFDELDVYDLYYPYKKRYYESMNMHHDAKSYDDKIKKRSVTSNTAIMAADEDDPFADMNFDEPETSEPVNDESSLEDDISDMNDTLDDLNDALTDFDEDDVDIETDNNIADHYIAECEKCHGVFITAIEVTDQEIEKISGTCPLCDEECDQYLKWIIKAKE